MNLFDMARREDPTLQVLPPQALRKERPSNGREPCFISMFKKKMGRDAYRGLHLVATKQPCVLKIKNGLSAFPFCLGTKYTGWRLLAQSESSENDVSIRLVSDDSILSESQCVVGREGAAPVMLPFGLDVPLGISGDIEIHVNRTDSKGVLLIDHRVLDRRQVVETCKGSGIEIGPGTNPQIMPSDEVTVTYLEQSPAENWARLYGGNKSIDHQLWDLYRIGNAHDIPFPDGTLDFIFSSHVFEHLVNPIGHLRYWRSKLVRGGKIVAIVPTVTGCKDYVHMPCELADLLEEDTQDIWEPQFRHYANWVRLRKSPLDPLQLMNTKRSIHVHFYEVQNISRLFAYAVAHLDYEWYSVDYEMNHKDMHCILSA